MAAIKIPKTPGACADRLYKLRDLQKPLRKQLEALDNERKAIEAHLINTLPKDDRGGIGHRAQAEVVTKEVPQVKDWDKLYKFILKTKDFSLLARSIKKEAVHERWADKKAVPGVESYTAVTVSVTKI